jgi:hypothetical protein
VRLLLTGELDETETLMAQLPARFLAAMTGLSDDIEASARRHLLGEQEREARERPMWLQSTGPGEVAAAANPANAGAPRPFHPPGPGAGQGATFPLGPHLGT